MKYGVKVKYYTVDYRVCPYGSEYYVEYKNIGIFDSKELAFKKIIKEILKQLVFYFKSIKDNIDSDDLKNYFNDEYSFNLGKINCSKNLNYDIINCIISEDECEENLFYIIKPLTEEEIESFESYYEF